MAARIVASGANRRPQVAILRTVDGNSSLVCDYASCGDSGSRVDTQPTDQLRAMYSDHRHRWKRLRLKHKRSPLGKRVVPKDDPELMKVLSSERNLH